MKKIIIISIVICISLFLPYISIATTSSLYVVMGTPSGYTYAYDIMTGSVVNSINANFTGGVAFGPDGYLYGTTGTGGVGAYDVTTHSLVNSIDISVPGPYGGADFHQDITFGPDGYLYGVADSGTIGVYDVNTGALVRSFGNILWDSSNKRYGGLVFSPDGYLYGVSGYNGDIHKFDVATGSVVDGFATNVVDGHALAGGLAFGPDGYLYGTSGGGHVGVFDVTTHSLVNSIDINVWGAGFHHDITFGTDGYLYGLADSGVIGVYDVSTESLVKSFGGNILFQKQSYSYLAFQPAPTFVPEPSTFLLVATGLAGLAGLRKKFKK